MQNSKEQSIEQMFRTYTKYGKIHLQNSNIRDAVAIGEELMVDENDIYENEFMFLEILTSP